MSPHFFYPPSRLGITHPTAYTHQLNLGVEEGGAAVLEPDFKFEFPGSQFTRLPLPGPESLLSKTPAQQLEEIHSLYTQAAQTINTLLNAGQQSIVLGGDHSVAYAHIQAVLERSTNQKVGILVFDSHGDLHTPETSPSGNFHGMWLRSIIDRHADQWANGSLRLCFVGNQVLEVEEVRFIQTHQIPVITSQMLKTPDWKKILTHFLDQVDILHVSFDIDVFSQELVSATSTPNPTGMSQEQIFRVIDEINLLHKADSLDLVEVNPRLSGANETVFLAQKVLLALTGSKYVRP